MVLFLFIYFGAGGGGGKEWVKRGIMSQLALSPRVCGMNRVGRGFTKAKRFRNSKGGGVGVG